MQRKIAAENHRKTAETLRQMSKAQASFSFLQPANKMSVVNNIFKLQSENTQNDGLGVLL